MSGWGFETDRVYNRREDIHRRFRGQQQGGICTPADHPVIFAFTGGVGRRYGYGDYRTDDGVFCLFGEGQRGDMEFRAGNRAIRDHVANGRDLLLFEMLGRGNVRFLNDFVCESWHEEQAQDKDDNLRRAIVFHLVPIGGNASEIGLSTSPNEDLEALHRRAMEAAETGTNRRQSDAKRSYWQRSSDVRNYVLKRANGACEACDSPAPFEKDDGTPFLETHHIRRLTDGGPDDPCFVAGICPNCHRRAHYGQDYQELNERLVAVVADKEARLWGSEGA